MTFEEWEKEYFEINLAPNMEEAFNAGRKAGLEEAAEIASDTLETDNPRLGDCFYGDKSALAILKRAGEIGRK